MPARQENAVAARRASISRFGGQRRHPTTAEVEYDADQTEFLLAVDAWKKRTGVKFPTLIELYAVLIELGYAKKSAWEDTDVRAHDGPGP